MSEISSQTINDLLSIARGWLGLVTISNAANVASIVGLALTIWVTWTLRAIRSSYLLRARIPELSRHLRTHSSKLSGYLNDRESFLSQICLPTSDGSNSRMPQDQDRWLEAIAKLTELTQAQKVKWSAQRNFDDDVIGPCYKAHHGGRHLRLTRHRVRIIDQYSGDSEIPQEYVLEFVDPQDVGLFTFPQTDATRDLYEAVRYQTSGVKDFIDGLFSEE